MQAQLYWNFALSYVNRTLEEAVTKLLRGWPNLKQFLPAEEKWPTCRSTEDFSSIYQFTCSLDWWKFWEGNEPEWRRLSVAGTEVSMGQCSKDERKDFLWSSDKRGYDEVLEGTKKVAWGTSSLLIIFWADTKHSSMYSAWRGCLKPTEWWGATCQWKYTSFTVTWI